jgi:hypothetical protein
MVQVYDGIWWYLMVYDGTSIWWYMMISDGIWWCIITLYTVYIYGILHKIIYIQHTTYVFVWKNVPPIPAMAILGSHHFQNPCVSGRGLPGIPTSWLEWRKNRPIGQWKLQSVSAFPGLQVWMWVENLRVGQILDFTRNRARIYIHIYI